ncbi:MAG: hypothetical protein ACRDEA_00570, partial [Microcystaceae cyanobacterium]
PSFIDPDTASFVRRSNDDLTKLAVANQVTPVRLSPLDNSRINMIYMDHGDQYARYGEDIAQTVDWTPIDLTVSSPEDIKMGIVGDLVTEPGTYPELTQAYTAEFLPKYKLLPASPEGSQELGTYIRNQHLYQDLSLEHNVMQTQYELMKDAVQSNIEDLYQNHPDIGRQNVFENPELPGYKEPPLLSPASETPGFVPSSGETAPGENVIQGFKRRNQIQAEDRDVEEFVRKSFIDDPSGEMFGKNPTQQKILDGLEQEGFVVSRLDENGKKLYKLADEHQASALEQMFKREMPPEQELSKLSTQAGDIRHDINPNAQGFADNFGKSEVVPFSRPENWKPSVSTDDFIRQLIARGEYPGQEVELAKQINETPFFHGTKSVFDIQKADPVQGAARSELGVGIHLTDNPDLAKAYADSMPGRNTPPVESRQIKNEGTILNVTPKVTNPIDATKHLTQEMKNAIKSAIDGSSFNSTVRRSLSRRLGKNVSYSDYFSEIEDTVLKYHKSGDFPEEELLNLQRNITQNLRDTGYDAVFFKPKNNSGKGLEGNQLMLLGNQNDNSLTNVATTASPGKNDALTQLANRYNVESAASKSFPKSKYAKTNFAESRNQLQTQMTHEYAQKADQVGQHAEDLADELMNQEKKLDAMNSDSKQIVEEQRDVKWKEQNDDTIGHFNKPEDDVC